MRLLRSLTYIALQTSLAITLAAQSQSISDNGGSVTTTGSGSTGITATASTTYPNIAAKTGNTASTSAFRIFNSSSAELLRVQSDGNLVIGGGTANERLTVGGSVGIPAGSKFMLNSAGTPYSIRLDSNNNVAFETNNADRMFITPAGSVGIGTTAPNEKLAVNGSFGITYGSKFMLNSGVGLTPYSMRLDYNTANMVFETNNTDRMVITPYGRVGVNVFAPTAVMEINPPSSPLFPVKFVDLLPSSGTNGMSLEMPANGEIHLAGLQIGKTALPVIQSDSGPLLLNYNSNNDVQIGVAGNTHGLQVLGNGMSNFAGGITVGGTLYANYQDLAEWVPAEDSLPAGTVVIQSDDVDNAVVASERAYDTRVAGVVSPLPGLLLGKEGPHKAKIATTGRVRVRVDATSAPIHRGDLLVSSDRSGVAMKSEPFELGGVKIHRPGTVIGKALESLPTGQGEILVLLTLQ